MITFGSLFTGIGGMDLGLERAGLVCKWQVEIDPYCREILWKHWPGVPKHGDIRQLTADQLEPVDLIAGGFPCQDVSSAGSRAGIQEGTRSGLWVEMLRIIRLVRPRFVLVENVSALLERLGGTSPAPISRVLGDLAGSGFDAEWDCLPTGLLSGHRRDRVFIVAYPVRQRSQGTGKNRISAEQARVFFVESDTPGFLRASPAPDVVRSIHGIPRRMDRIKALGNSVHPAAAKWIGERIAQAGVR